MHSDARVERASGVDLYRGDLAGLDAMRADAVGLFVFCDVQPLSGVAGYVDWRLYGGVSRCLETGLFGAAEGEAMMLLSSGRFGRRRVFVFGLGSVGGCDHAAFRRAAREALDVMKRAGAADPVLAAPDAMERPGLEGEFVNAVAAELPDRGTQVLVGGDVILRQER